MTTQRPQAPVSQMLLTVAAFIIVVAGMKAASSLLVPFLLAAFITIICTPIMAWLKRRGMPSWLAMFVVIFGVLLIGFLVSSFIASSVSEFTRDLPAYQEALGRQITEWDRFLNNVGMEISSKTVTDFLDPGAAMNIVATGLNSLRTVLTNAFLIVMTVVFMLMEASGLPTKLLAILGDSEDSLKPFESFIENVKQYMAIKTWISLGTGILVAVWLMVMGVAYAMLWAMLAFFLNYIPNIGSILAAIPAVLLALIQFGIIKAAVVGVGYLVINTLMGSIIEPRFLGKELGLSTLVVFMSLLFWGWVLGPVGMLLSVPLTMMAKIALDNREETRWIAILLGPDLSRKRKQAVPMDDPATQEASSEN